MKTIATKYIARHHLISEVAFQKHYDAVVVIPVLADDLIFETLESLDRAYQYSSQHSVAVLVVVNHSEDETPSNKQENAKIYQTLQNARYAFDVYSLSLFDLPDKQSGVGVARKAGMDQALLHFVQYQSVEMGIIISLDADTLVASNYFDAIFSHFYRRPKTNAVILHFEHLLSDDEQVQRAITLYELYLRYYVEALRWCGFPFAFHTIGSAFAVSGKAYVSVSGMSQNKAGEDFYFLHKIFPMGNIYNITDTTVFPSPRISNKTPFGTGKAVAELIEQQFVIKTYPLEWFRWLKIFFAEIDFFYTASRAELQAKISKFEPLLQKFLQENDFDNTILKLQQNTASAERFRKAFFIWFDGFKIVKFLNFAALHFSKEDLMTAIHQLTKETTLPFYADEKQLIKAWRQYHKERF